jgi:hypothetical protein
LGARQVCGPNRRQAVLSTPGAREQGMHQCVRSRSQIFRWGALSLVVTESILAGHENHRRRHDSRDVHGVVSGAAQHIDVCITMLVGGVAYSVDELLRKLQRRDVVDVVGSVALMAKSGAAGAAAINQRRRLYHHEGVMMQEAGGV